MKRDQILPLIILIGAFLLRLLFLDWRPPHFDEGINGWFVDQMWSNGFYSYDPSNYHGPLHFYFLQLSEVLFGRNIWALRFVTVLVSTVTVLFTLKHREFLGRVAIWAAIFMALSPAMVFMGRYAIHETWVTLFLVIFNYGVMRWFFKQDGPSLIYIFLGIAGAFMSKETAIIHFAMWAVAFAYLWFTEPQIKKNMPPTEILILGIMWVLVAIYILFSGFGLKPTGFLDFFKAFLPWFNTGTQGAGHEKHFLYWFDLIFEYEFYAFFALLGALFLFKKDGWFRYIFLNAFLTLLVYSIVKYKTPWCASSIYTFFPFVAGYVVEFLRTSERPSVRFLYYTAFVVVIALMVKTIELNFINYASPKEKFVYVHTTKNYFKISKPIENVIAENPANKNMVIIIRLDSPWPLSWVYSNFPKVAYGIAQDLNDFDIAMIDLKNQKELEEKIKVPYYKAQFPFREYMADILVYYKKSLFEKYVEPMAVVNPKEQL